jgi:superfamily II DNA or RNA helicase
MTFQLRPYQADLVDRTIASMTAGGTPCLVAPTGAGKTVMVAEIARIARDQGHRVVVVAHRQEIIHQLRDSLRRHLPPSTRMETIGAGSKPRWNADVTIAMVPTLARRIRHLEQLRGAVMLCDEAHHCGATSWKNVTAAIAPIARIGATATPIRPDGKGMGDEGGFTELVVGPQVRELMDMGCLCDYKLFASPNRVTTEGLKKRAGDFRQEDLEQRVVAINGSIVADWQRWGGNQKTITVCVGVDHAHEVAERFREAGIAAAAVDGNTPKAVRDRIFEDFRSDGLTVLTACAVVDEGLDVPAATVLQVTRPTASLRLWKQLLGRVMRPSPGKEHCVILDHTDNWRRLPAPDEDIQWDLHAEAKQIGPPRQVKADPITQEITLSPLTVAEFAEAELQEISPAMLRNAKPKDQRELLDRQARAQIERVIAGEAPQKDVLPLMGRVALLELETAARLGMALGFGANWGTAMWERAREVVDTDRLNRLTRKTVKALT